MLAYITSNMSAQQPHIYLISQARSACHFLERMLSGQPDTVYAQAHYAAPARLLQVKLIDEGPVEDNKDEKTKDDLKEVWRKGWEQLKNLVDSNQVWSHNQYNQSYYCC